VIPSNDLQREIELASRRMKTKEPMQPEEIFFWSFAVAVAVIVLAMIIQGVFFR
jgi:hypothetical protein